MISVTIVIKGKNVAHVTPSIIHKKQQLNIQSSVRAETCEVILPGW